MSRELPHNDLRILLQLAAWQKESGPAVLVARKHDIILHIVANCFIRDAAVRKSLAHLEAMGLVYFENYVHKHDDAGNVLPTADASDEWGLWVSDVVIRRMLS